MRKMPWWIHLQRAFNIQHLPIRGLLTSLMLLLSYSCSENNKSFESPNKWFSLSYPASWQAEYQEGIYTFTDTQDATWAFQVSAYKVSHDSVSDFNITRELQWEKQTHPSAVLVDLKSRKAIYYTEQSKEFTLHYWIVGGKRCKALCTFTTSSIRLPSAFDRAKNIVGLIILQ